MYKDKERIVDNVCIDFSLGFIYDNVYLKYDLLVAAHVSAELWLHLIIFRLFFFPLDFDTFFFFA